MNWIQRQVALIHLQYAQIKGPSSQWNPESVKLQRYQSVQWAASLHTSDQTVWQWVWGFAILVMLDDVASIITSALVSLSVCNMCSVWTCHHPWGECVTGGKPVTFLLWCVSLVGLVGSFNSWLDQRNSSQLVVIGADFGPVYLKSWPGFSSCMLWLLSATKLSQPLFSLYPFMSGLSSFSFFLQSYFSLFVKKKSLSINFIFGLHSSKWNFMTTVLHLSPPLFVRMLFLSYTQSSFTTSLWFLCLVLSKGSSCPLCLLSQSS